MSSFEGARANLTRTIFRKLVLALRDAHFRGPFAVLDARPYHEAGATDAQELGTILASAVWWLRAFERAGVAPAGALPLLGASLSVDRDAFASVGGIRALRLLWARLLEVCDLPQLHLPVHAETSRRMIVRADPHTNLLRTTIAAFAAGVGGADSVTVLPHTAALGLPDRDARALARNIQHLLMEEADIRGVADAAAGSGAIEALTESLQRARGPNSSRSNARAELNRYCDRRAADARRLGARCARGLRGERCRPARWRDRASRFGRNVGIGTSGACFALERTRADPAGRLGGGRVMTGLPDFARTTWRRPQRLPPRRNASPG